MKAMATAKPASGANTFMDNVKTIVYALALAMVIRFAIVQPFRIPSGSMQPTLMVGDYIVVTKWSYGYSKYSFAIGPYAFGGDGRVFASDPERGDIAVFRPTNDTDRDFVKRVVGLPGDEIEMRDGRLYINGEAVQRERIGDTLFKERVDGQIITHPIPTYVETLPNGVSYRTFDKQKDGPGDNTQVFRVPEGHFFMMGDDRDGSSDSRYEVQGFGPVPRDHLVGKAQFVFLSMDYETSLAKPWTLLTGLRGDRFFHGVN